MNKWGGKEIKITSVNHITFAVSDLKKSIEFYKKIFGDCLVAKSEKLAYFNVSGLWFALNIESEIKGDDRQKTYTHIAFSMDLENQRRLIEKLEHYNISYEQGRSRNIREGSSLYIRDYDGHLIEFHNKDLSDRLAYYSEEREDVEVYV